MSLADRPNRDPLRIAILFFLLEYEGGRYDVDHVAPATEAPRCKHLLCLLGSGLARDVRDNRNERFEHETEGFILY